MKEIPEWLNRETFSVQHNPNCPSAFLVRLIGRGRATLDMKPYFSAPDQSDKLTRDALGFGATIHAAAEKAKEARAKQDSSMARRGIQRLTDKISEPKG